MIDDGIALHAPVDAPATWVLSNHDVVRHVTRYGRADTRFTLDYRQIGRTDRPRARDTPGPGRRSCCCWRCPARRTSTRARNSACTRSRTSRTSCARTRCSGRPAAPTPAATAAGCRCRGPATCRRSGSARPASAVPWLPQPAAWKGFTVAAQQGDPSTRCSSSTGRRCGTTGPRPDSATGRWPGSTPGRDVLAFAARRRLRLPGQPVGPAVALPAHEELILASGPLVDGLLPTDTAVWLRIA